MPADNLPYLGFGLGLRTQHYEDILETKPAVDWFEIISENYLVPGGKPLHYLDKIREHYSMVMHGVSMSIGGSDPLDKDYLRQLKDLIDRVEPHWVSDHLCWTGLNGINAHDLLPLPYTEEAINHVADRIKQVQDYLGRQILMENVSSYVAYRQSGMEEWEFYTEICERADCFMLFDINNIYVSAINHETNPLDYINYVPKERVQQYHLAGHSDYTDYIIDTHDHDVPDSVWELYRHAVRRFGNVSTMIERDDNIPELSVLLNELARAQQIHQEETEAAI